MTRKLVITVNLDRFHQPDKSDLDEYGFTDEAEWWIHYAYSDPVSMFDGATWQVVDEAVSDAN